MATLSAKEQARKQGNLRLLQRTISSDIVDIDQTAIYVVLYDFIDGSWQKADMEGSLFLVHYPYQLIILNRNSNANFQMQVTADFQLQDQEPYLIVRESAESNRIRGIWVSNGEERVAVAAVLKQTIDQLRDGSIGAVAPPPPTPASIWAAKPVATMAAPGSSPPGMINASQEHHHASDEDVSALANTLASSMAMSAAVPADGGVAATKEPIAQQATPTAASPMARSTSASSTGSGGGGIALDKKSLQLALLSLIQDERFLDLLHSQYLRVVHARAKKLQSGQQNNTPPR